LELFLNLTSVNNKISCELTGSPSLNKGFELNRLMAFPNILFTELVMKLGFNYQKLI